ncbi:MAG: hypothetical protein A2X23_04110, partial [Chloroflexi bacterium GWC2_73_18]
MAEIEVGPRLRQLRAARGLSLREVAVSSGLTPSFVSQVELGRASPSIASLSRLAEVLGVSVGQLFDGLPPYGHLVRRDQRRVIRLRGLGEVDEYVTAGNTGLLQVSITTLEPGGRTSEEPFVHESEEECLLVLEGTVEAHVGGERHRLEAGDAITYSARLPHLARNAG